MIIHKFDGKKLKELIDNHNKIVAMNEEEKETVKEGEISTNSFNHSIPHDSPIVFNITLKRAFELKRKIERYFYDYKLNGDKIRKNIYTVDSGEVMKYILDVAENVPEILFLTFECGVLCAPLYPEYDK